MKLHQAGQALLGGAEAMCAAGSHRSQLSEDGTDEQPCFFSTNEFVEQRSICMTAFVIPL